MVEGGSTKFSVEHQEKDIHHPPSIFFSFFSLVDPTPFPFPELDNKNTIISFLIHKILKTKIRL